MEEKILNQVLDVVVNLQKDMNLMKQDMNEMKQDMNEMKQDIKLMKQDIVLIKEEQEIMKQDIAIMKVQIGELIKEQRDTRIIIQLIVEEIGKINIELKRQANDKCVFHKRLVEGNQTS